MTRPNAYFPQTLSGCTHYALFPALILPQSHFWRPRRRHNRTVPPSPHCDRLTLLPLSRPARPALPSDRTGPPCPPLPPRHRPLAPRDNVSHAHLRLPSLPFRACRPLPAHRKHRYVDGGLESRLIEQACSQLHNGPVIVTVARPGTLSCSLLWNLRRPTATRPRSAPRSGYQRANFAAHFAIHCTARYTRSSRTSIVLSILYKRAAARPPEPTFMLSIHVVLSILSRPDASRSLHLITVQDEIDASGF
jgi:hypothetical protein